MVLSDFLLIELLIPFVESLDLANNAAMIVMGILFLLGNLVQGLLTCLLQLTGRVKLHTFFLMWYHTFCAALVFSEIAAAIMIRGHQMTAQTGLRVHPQVCIAITFKYRANTSTMVLVYT